MEINPESLEKALKYLGNLLADRDLQYEVVAIGGAGLILLGLITRSTKDIDLVALMDKGRLIPITSLPNGLLQAADDTGKALKLGKGWMNPGPASLLRSGLPKGFQERLSTRYYGTLTVHFASRFDQICFKLYASVDHGPFSKHISDLKLLNPTKEELKSASRWCHSQDPSELFSEELNKALIFLGKD